jgi:hypothetical protein
VPSVQEGAKAHGAPLRGAVYTPTYEQWDEVAQWFADNITLPASRGIMCCPWCDLAANSGGGPTDEERFVIVRRHQKRLSAAPFWSAWLADWMKARAKPLVVRR